MVTRAVLVLGLSAGGSSMALPSPAGDTTALSGLWPWPTGEVTASGPPLAISRSFAFQGPPCPRLDRAFQRYAQLLDCAEAPNALARLHVSIADESSCDRAPAHGENESYLLEIAASGATLHARAFAGAVRGLETFSQLSERCSINASAVRITDAPRFSWRGTMLDSARHFLPVPTILKMLDAMAFNKLNVLHWHISDAQAFPLRTATYPQLARGAYALELSYGREDVERVVAAASDRAIRVVPELDTPGHAASWAAGYPDLIVSECGTLDPTSEAALTMMDSLVGELSVLFPDSHLHLGCDEVPFACWNNSAKVTAQMAAQGFPRTLRGFKRLTALYIGRLQRIAKRHGRTAVAWQEAFDHYGDTAADPTPPSTEVEEDMIIEQWFSPAWNWANLSAITGRGYLGSNSTWPRGFRTLVTNGWYLDSTAVNSWEDIYEAEPLTNMTCSNGVCTCQCHNGPWRDGRCHCFDLRGTEAAQLVLGGEAPLWGEYIDAQNLFPRAFPRLAAVAERLWSRMEVNKSGQARPRLELHRCRLLDRGVEVTPLGPGFCRPPAAPARGTDNWLV